MIVLNLILFVIAWYIGIKAAIQHPTGENEPLIYKLREIGWVFIIILIIAIVGIVCYKLFTQIIFLNELAIGLTGLIVAIVYTQCIKIRRKNTDLDIRG